MFRPCIGPWNFLVLLAFSEVSEGEKESDMERLKQIIVEMRGEIPATAAADRTRAAAPPSALPALPGVSFDPTFPAVPIAAAEEARPGAAFSAMDEDEGDDVSPPETTFIVRATLAPDQDPVEVARKLKGAAGSKVVEVFADVAIQPALICPGSPPLGTDADVETLLAVEKMRRKGLDGCGVTVAIVDTGINMAYLNSRGKTPRFNRAKSWGPIPGLDLGNLPVDHGTMCAYDVCIAAPECTLIDIALLLSQEPGGTIMEGFLSDGVRAYRHLIDLMQARCRPGENPSLVVNNSWGMFHPSWDYPIGHPGNYSHNINHPFNRIVTMLERKGADILFAAGNCGADCPDGRCQGVTDRAIYGANSHPRVLSVAGVDVSKERVGYSSMGPGNLTRRKPDLSGYTHFKGSGVYSADGGTSAATPVVAGVVAAVRTRMPLRKNARPSTIRNLMRKTAEDLGRRGYDYAFGYGVASGKAIARTFRRQHAIAVAAPARLEGAAPGRRPLDPGPELPSLIEGGSQPAPVAVKPGAVAGAGNGQPVAGGAAGKKPAQPARREPT
jgi:subtilisin family serine protease